MALHFVDPSAGGSADNNVGNQGHTLDLPWNTLEWALESGVLIAGDTVAIRRTHSEIPGSDIACAYDGTVASPIKIFGSPRAAHAISSSDWTNGSTSVNNDDADMDREKHQARYITGPDGETYFITRIIDASTIIIDREYAGGTVNNDATASIQADNTQSDWDGYDDSGDVIKKAGWNADADDLPVIDFNDGDFQISINTDANHVFENIEFKDSTDSQGIVNANVAENVSFIGCLFKQSTQDDSLVSKINAFLFFQRCTLEGSGAGAAQRGINDKGAGFIHLKDCAIYNMGDNGINTSEVIFCENVNIGVEIANGDSDIYFERGGILSGRDIKLGGTNGTVGRSTFPWRSYTYIENYNKILGEHRTFYLGGYFEKVAVSGETPNKKVSDNVLKIVPNVNSAPIEEWAYTMMVHELEMTAAAHTLKYWIYNDSGVTINDGDARADIWLKAEYISSYDDTSEYTIPELFSAENTIADAADADDWDSLSVTITPAVASKVRLTLYLSFYSAAGTLFIDPAVVIS